MKKLIVLFTLVVFVGVIAAPVFASSESGRIILVNNDDDPPKKNKENKEDKQNKETTKPEECPRQKECKQDCHQTSKPSPSDDKKKSEEKK